MWKFKIEYLNPLNHFPPNHLLSKHYHDVWAMFPKEVQLMEKAGSKRFIFLIFIYNHHFSLTKENVRGTKAILGLDF